MSKWVYTLTSGQALHDAINQSDEKLTIKCLLACYKELYDKLTDEDKDWKGFDIEDAIDILTHYNADPDDEDDIDNHLE